MNKIKIAIVIIATFTVFTSYTVYAALQSDLNNDGEVNVFDLEYIGKKWGSDDEIADINGDGIVNVLDLSIMSKEWGRVEQPIEPESQELSIPGELPGYAVGCQIDDEFHPIEDC